jgi:arginine N-succinyltransferase
LTEEGRSEFWEALGRRFTGLPYQEADLLSQSHKEFIESLFPQEDIYLALLDAKARLVLGRVGEATKPAQHLLESIGFSYLDEVDPFDGGPHYGAATNEILPIRQGKKLKATEHSGPSFKEQVLVASANENFRVTLTAVDVRGDEVCIPAKARALLEVENGEEVFVSPFHYNRG